MSERCRGGWRGLGAPSGRLVVRAEPGTPGPPRLRRPENQPHRRAFGRPAERPKAGRPNAGSENPRQNADGLRPSAREPGTVVSAPARDADHGKPKEGNPSGLTTGEVGACPHIPSSPLRRPSVVCGMPPDAPGVKATPPNGKPRRLGPRLDVLAPVGAQGLPMGGSAGEEGRERPARLVAVQKRTATRRENQNPRRPGRIA